MSVQVPKGYKQTEVGVIPEDWNLKTFGQVLSICHGKSQREVEVEDGPYPILASGGKIGTAKLPLYEYDSVLIGRKGTINKPQFMSSPFWTVDTLFYSRINSGNCAKFIYYLFCSIDWMQHNEASGVPSLNARTIEAIQRGYPLNPEQQAIAEALSDADALIESLEQLIAKKRQIKQGAMQELLTGQRRLPGFSGEWEKKKLGDLASIQRGASPRPIDSPIWFDEHSNVGWVRISDVSSSSMFLMKTSQCLSDLGIKNSRFVKKSSLIMSICATVGRPIITEIDVCIHDGFVVFDELSIEKEFLYYYLKFIEPGWSKHGQTGSQMNLNTPLINGTEISVPGQNEQKAIADLLFSLDAEIDEIENLLTKSRQIKQSMMQELLTGHIRLL